MNNHQNGREPRGLSSISGALKNLCQKTNRICLECGEEFEAANLGIATRIYCDKCSEEKAKQGKEREEAARQTEAESRHRQLIAFAQIPPKWKDVTFDNSDPDLYPRQFKIAKHYAERFNPQSPSLAFYSEGNGVGKTRLAACIANHVLHELRYPVLFKKARDLMLEIRRTFSDKGEMTEADILDKVLSVQLLVLDDVGLDPTSQWLQATYWTVFDRRLEWQLPVIITTTISFETLGGKASLANRIGDGALSRLVELCQGNVIDCSGPDLR